MLSEENAASTACLSVAPASSSTSTARSMASEIGVAPTLRVPASGNGRRAYHRYESSFPVRAAHGAAVRRAPRGLLAGSDSQ